MNNKDVDVNAVQLPQHDKPLVIEPLDYSNPYDYHKPHRHDYFEIILVKNGKGRQFIDFQEYNMLGEQLYAIYPGQIHLMYRNTATGLLIQFRKDIFKFLQPLKHYQLYFPEQVFNLDTENFNHLYDVTERMMRLLENKELTPFAHHKIYSYLQIILISLPELHDAKSAMLKTNIVTEFLSLLPQHIKTQRKVSDYCNLMECSTEKLNDACKASLGKTPLKLIHEELILEIRRLMLLNKLSLKEIAFELNFDSQANFSNFIKSQSKLTPSELQATTLEIYK
ncbi:helix-turn-helix domain-containing protein [Flavobacterium arcticum]|uniref:Helix-turn-helix domain-containing protein n=1 Tax=Flavobacterium arcticum TaxID=1784713 RepID=A0A345HBM6_9FLAO|nr:helix-turn-helix transcriptional regulator [Flavobacterium arcticum]AXG73986.1 helix-turn-helix domain-containing protein [Flavobacterium arcticum]KAF2508964.1 helix-turn-helix domain-containing protein [Flavobacterium arcticum]